MLFLFNFADYFACMDTTNIMIDTLAVEAANNMELVEKTPDPVAIFFMGVVGVFAFVLLYIVITKLSAVIIRKLNKNKQENE